LGDLGINKCKLLKKNFKEVQRVLSCCGILYWRASEKRLIRFRVSYRR